MAIKPTFPELQPAAIASYSFSDIAAGTGITTLYGIRQEVSGAVTWNLIENPVEGGGSATQQRLNDNVTYTFDLTQFNIPRDAKGTAYLSGTMQNTGGGGTEPTATITLQKVSDVTTDITSGVITAVIANSTAENFFIPLEIPTSTHFKKGDILRMSVRMRASANNYLHVNPVDATNQPLKLFFPFEIID